MSKIGHRLEPKTRPPEIRKKDFDEVELTVSPEEAMKEASRDIKFCAAPCSVRGCPVNVNVPGFLKKVSEGDFKEAYKILIQNTPVPSITGRVCQQEIQCEGQCVLRRVGEPIAIGAVERFVGDWALDNNIEIPVTVEKKHKKVAVVGSGPSGIVAAADLARMGYDVTMYEAFHIPGGVLAYGIPEFRLPKRILKKEFERLQNLGVDIELGVVVGTTYTIPELLKDYNAVFLGVGAGRPMFLNVPGENLAGIYTANEFLTRVNLMKAYMFPEYDTPIHVGKKVAVIGAGNTAMDAARSALRLGADVYVIYRRGRNEVSARAVEFKHAEEEGVKFIFWATPSEFQSSDGVNVSNIKLMKMKPGEPDRSGRPRPVPTGETFDFDADMVITAIGFYPNPLIPQMTQGLKVDDHGRVVVDLEGRTSIPHVYAGGDIVTGESTVIEAMGWGRRVARAIDKDLQKI